MTSHSHQPVDWRHWHFSERATLMFLHDDRQILLIKKKRGLGAGKVTGPGGKLEGGETPLECAQRETREEVGLQVSGGHQVARLKFQFTDGYALQVEAFLSKTWSGSLQETEEALPFWTPCDAIPFESMWADDVLWLPRVLRGELVCGHFLFEKDRMLTQDIHSVKATHWTNQDAY